MVCHHRTADVPLAGGVFGEHDVSRAKDPLGAIANLDLDLPIEHDHIVSPRRVVPVVIVIPAGLPKDDTDRLDQL